MSNIPIRDMTQSGTPDGTSLVAFDNGTMRKGTVASMADAVRPVATQSEATAGSDNAKVMSALRVKQSVASEIGVTVQGFNTNLADFAGKTAPAGAVVGTTDPQTLSNKNLTSPNITSPTGIVKGDVGLGNVPNVDATNAANIGTGTLPAGRLPALTGDVTSSAGSTATTIASNVVTNAKSAQMVAYTLKGNPSGVLANASDFTIGSLTAKASPVGTDEIMIADNAAGGALKRSPVSALAGGGGSVASYNGLTGAIAAFTADKRIFVSTSGNDSNNGLSPESAKLTIQAAVNAANPGGTVYIGAGTFTGAIAMQPGVQIIGEPGTIITQANGANLTTLINFQTNSAHGAAIRGCQIDGNRANNTDDDTKAIILVGTANNVALEYNRFRNMGGSCIIVGDGLNPIICRNDFQNVMTMCISSGRSVPGTTNGKYNDNTFSNNLGQHVIYVPKSDGNEIRNNRIIATQLIGVANVSGHTVTWVSGQNFAGFLPGGFFIASPSGSFTEGYIQQVNSSTTLTIRESYTATGIAFVAGTGDIINIGNSLRNKVSGNIISFGASGGIVVHNFYGAASLLGTTIEDNEISYCGGSGISVQSTSTSPTTYSSDTTIQNNRIVSCGQGGAAVGVAGQNAISLIDFAPTTLGSCIIRGNRMQNDSVGGASMQWGIYFNGLSNGQCYAGQNTCIGIANAGIRNGATVTLGAGFGSTAVVGTLVTHGDNVRFGIVPGGTGIAANPALAINTAASSLHQPPMPIVKMIDVNGAVMNILQDVNYSATNAVVNAQIFGTTGNTSYTPTSGIVIYVTAKL